MGGEVGFMNIPGDVPKSMKKEFLKNYNLATKKTGRLMLFAGDQKIEHLADDFVGKKIAKEDIDPEHFFKIASKGIVGVFAAQLGLIAKYGPDYKKISYLVKMNSKTKLADSEPLSQSLVDFEDVLEFKKNSGLNIVGVGYTVYIGSEFEHLMLEEAGRLVTWAHQHGLITVLWMYPRGKKVINEKDPHIVAGAAGVAVSLGADFAKVNYPEKKGLTGKKRAKAFQEAVKLAGRTKIITSGGSSRNVKKFLQETYDQIHVSRAMGNATGRNIHQKSLDEAVRMTKAISAITLGNKDVEFAYKVYKGEKKFRI